MYVVFLLVSPVYFNRGLTNLTRWSEPYLKGPPHLCYHFHTFQLKSWSDLPRIHPMHTCWLAQQLLLPFTSDKKQMWPFPIQLTACISQTYRICRAYNAIQIQLHPIQYTTGSLATAIHSILQTVRMDSGRSMQTVDGVRTGMQWWNWAELLLLKTLHQAQLVDRITILHMVKKATL